MSRLSTITLGEIRSGIATLPDGRRRQHLQQRFEDEVVPLFEARILPLDEPATHAYATVRSAARRGGKTIRDLDALIAATARVTGFSVATRDRLPFNAAGVPVIDPFGSAT